MRFLDNEWYQEHEKRLREMFSEPGRSATELTEVYRNVWGEPGKTVWVYYKMDKGQLADIKYGEGEDSVPSARFRCFGDYEGYVKVCKGQLDPKTGILTGVFALEGGLASALGMLGTYYKLTECKKLPGMEY